MENVASKAPWPRRLAANLEWRQKLLKCGEKWAESLWWRCREDFLFWVESFVYTYDPSSRRSVIVPFILYDYQREAAEVMVRLFGKGDIGIEKSRQMGATWLCCVLFLWRWLFWDGQAMLMVSRKESYVDAKQDPKSLFWKLEFILRHLPPWFLPAEFDWKRHRRMMHLYNPANGSVIDGEATVTNVGRGDNRTAIMLDEFAVMPDGYAVLAATRDASACRIVNSTPQGTDNAYFDLMSGKQGRIAVIRMHWSQHPHKRRGLYTSVGGQYRMLDVRYWRQYSRDEAIARMVKLDERLKARGIEPEDNRLRSPWYVRQCERAGSIREIAQELDIDYQTSGGGFFPQWLIEKRIEADAKVPILVGELKYDAQEGRPIKFVRSEFGRLRLWTQLDAVENPPPNNYVMGIDISLGAGMSNSVACIYNKQNEKVAEFVCATMTPEAFARLSVALARWFHDARMIWESAGPGLSFASVVAELGYTHVYARRGAAAAGYYMNKDSRMHLFSSYREALERGEIANRSREALAECLEYVVQNDGTVVHSRLSRGKKTKLWNTGAQFSHGDRMIADALAWHLLQPMAVRRKKSSLEERLQEQMYVPGTWAWRRRQRLVGARGGEGWAQYVVEAERGTPVSLFGAVK